MTTDAGRRDVITVAIVFTGLSQQMEPALGYETHARFYYNKVRMSQLSTVCRLQDTSHHLSYETPKKFRPKEPLFEPRKRVHRLESVKDMHAAI